MYCKYKHTYVHVHINIILHILMCTYILYVHSTYITCSNSCWIYNYWIHIFYRKVSDKGNPITSPPTSLHTVRTIHVATHANMYVTSGYILQKGQQYKGNPITSPPTSLYAYEGNTLTSSPTRHAYEENPLTSPPTSLYAALVGLFLMSQSERMWSLREPVTPCVVWISRSV